MPYYKRNILVLSVTVFLASLSWQQIVPFLPKFLKEIGGGGPHFETWVSVIFAAQSLAAMIAQPSWGKLGDTFGRKPMILRAGLCLAGVYYAMSLCRSPWQLALCRFLNGALTGFIPGSFALVSTNTPEEKAPRYVALLESTSNVGLIVGPTIGAVLARFAGYRMSMVMSGTAILISTIAVWFLVEEPNKTVIAEKTSLLQDFREAFRSPVLASLLVTIGLAWSYGNSINPYLVLHLESLSGWRPWWLPALTYSLPGIAFVLVAYRWSLAGQKWGYDKNIMIGLGGGAIGALLLYGAHNIWLFALVYFATGILMATLSPGVGAVTCTMVPQEFRGRAYGIQQAAGTLAAFLCILATGQVARTFGYHAIFLFVSVLFIAGFFVFRNFVRKWEKP
ncbi:MAG: MFS transporter [Capsulimonadaceae bacterium]|nr:MFS transporter [Capsulimonadaceae bacterium]